MVSKVVKHRETECGYQGLGVGSKGSGEFLFSGYKVSVLQGEKVLEILPNNVLIVNTTILYI